MGHPVNFVYKYSCLANINEKLEVDNCLSLEMSLLSAVFIFLIQNPSYDFKNRKGDKFQNQNKPLNSDVHVVHSQKPHIVKRDRHRQIKETTICTVELTNPHSLHRSENCGLICTHMHELEENKREEKNNSKQKKSGDRRGKKAKLMRDKMSRSRP
jgi:hypothetical protein